MKNNVIECVTQHCILGLTVEQNLCCKKLSSVIGLLSYEMRTYCYKAFILSHLDYCIMIWGGATSILINKLYKLLKREACTLLDVNFDMSSTAIFKVLNCMTVYERVDFSRYITMFKIVNGLMPNYLFNCLSIKVKSKHNLRCHQDFLYYSPTKIFLKDRLCTMDLICGINFQQR